ncbi:MAG: hypothetical protein GF317_10050 [Candidatus Lokiarchaeota archaeon]|nr:hypothetical protein [Candidatus Lokiarchaeota archaeon]
MFPNNNSDILMDDRNIIKSILSRLENSEEFYNSKKYLDLLKYLIEKTEKGVSPKEKDIATEVLEKGDDFDPIIDTSVRVYIYRLRKKLNDYYKNEGHLDKVRISIPKGEYHVEFSKHKQNKDQNHRHRNNLPLTIVTIILFMSLSALIYLWHDYLSFQKSLKIIDKHNDIWSPFLNSERSTLLVLGDHFFYASRENNDYSTDKHIRSHKINNMDDFNEFLAHKQNSSNIQYFKDDEYFLDPYCVQTLIYMNPIFYGVRKNFEIKMASRVIWDDFRNYNIIFVGSFKTLGIFNTLFNNLHIKYELFPLPNKIIITDSLSNSMEIFNTSITKQPPLFRREYSMIATMPLPNNNVILLLCGFNYIGVEMALKTVTIPERLKKCEANLIKEFGSIPSFFEMVYQVEGFPKNSMYCNFLAAFEIPESYSISTP